mmetsp:Transcript_3700/g.13291  ORF Transcript_3700/g.13291 Transcript_3700/m.13291 type:complete len:111 (-) Transcript_3700:55-387(-)
MQYPASLSEEEAMESLKAVVERCFAKCDKYRPTVITASGDYLYVEFSKSGPIGTTIDDVEFYFPKGGGRVVEYRSATRGGGSSLTSSSNRRRIKSLREQLEQQGWSSAGY